MVGPTTRLASGLRPLTAVEFTARYGPEIAKLSAVLTGGLVIGWLVLLATRSEKGPLRWYDPRQRGRWRRA